MASVNNGATNAYAQEFANGWWFVAAQWISGSAAPTAAQIRVVPSASLVTASINVAGCAFFKGPPHSYIASGASAQSVSAGYSLASGAAVIDSAGNLTATTVGAGAISNSGNEYDVGSSLLAPTSGSTITLSSHATILHPSGTLATLTVKMPASPGQGEIHGVSTTQTLTALTVSPNTGQSVAGTPSALASGGSFKLIYLGTTWYPYP
jgi:hypothetical protein